MKQVALIGLILWLTSCAAGDRSSLALTAVPIENTATSPPTRSVELTPTSTAVIPATIPLVVTKPIEARHPDRVCADTHTHDSRAAHWPIGCAGMSAASYAD